MKTKPTSNLKLLILGAFVALTSTAFGQSITVKHFENGNLSVPSFFTNNTPRLCATDSVQLEATGFTGTLSWSGPSGAISATTTTIWVDEQGTYNLSDGTNSASVTIGKDGSNPLIYSDDYPITASANSGVGAFENSVSPAGGLFGLLSPTKEYLAPFGAEYAYNKQQYLYTASELTTLGFGDGTTVKEIGFYLKESWNGNCNTHVEIRVYQTSNSALSNFETGSSNYLGSWSCDLNYQSGWNYFDFGDFDWNGTDNLVFEFCYNTWNNSTAQNPLFALDDVGFNASVVAANLNSVCSSTSGFAIADYRPSTAFRYSNAARQDTIVLCGSSAELKLTETAASYAWSSLNSTYSGTTNSLSVSTDDLVYVTGLTSQFCKYDDTVQVYSAAESVPTITSSATDFCSGESVTLSTTLTSGQSARWSNGETGNQVTISDGGTYTVTISNDFGCSKTSNDEIITEVEKPELYLTHDGFDVLNESHHYVGDKKFKKLFDDGSGKMYFFSDESMQISDLPSILSGNNSSATPTSIDNATEDQQIHNAHNNYHTTVGGVYQLGISGRYQHQDASVIWDNGSTSSYTNWDVNNIYASADNTYIAKYYYNSKWEANGNTWSQVLVEYNQSDLKLTSGEIFCDSVQLFAPTEFESFVWSTGETTSSIWVSGSGNHSVYVTGTYTKSDGTTCSLTSDTYTFTINNAPTLAITNNSGTTDLTGSNTISLTASYSSGASFSWSTGATTDNISVSSAGTYTATATLNGCSVSETVNTYEPIFVAKDGDNTTGDGTITNPYLTINHAISRASEGDKIVVRPGTYAETVDIDKGVVIHSDAERLDNLAYIDSTIIDANGSQGFVMNDVHGNHKVEISGFVVKDANFSSSNDGGAFRFNNNYSTDVTISNVIVKDAGKNGFGFHAFIMANNIRSLRIVGSDFLNSGSQQDNRYPFGINSVGLVEIQGIEVRNVEFAQWLFQVANVSQFKMENSIITELNFDWSDKAIFKLQDVSTFFQHVSIWNNQLGEQSRIFDFDGSNVDLLVNNSILESGNSDIITTGIDYNISNSVIYPSLGGNGTNNGNGVLLALAKLNSDGSLKNVSPAIGVGSSSFNSGATVYTSPVLDIYGNSRPNPTGSNPDAGAVESSLAIGDFGAEITSCGYGLNASVYNSDNYSIEWVSGGNVVSTEESFTASSKGVYTLNVYSVDRSDTITKTHNLNNPLSMEIFDVSNSCSVISSNNGNVTWGNIQGGVPFTTEWWSYQTAVRNESGTQIDGYWQLSDGQNWSYTKSNLSAGKYYFFVEDASGCEVGDTVEIVKKDQETYYVSTTGDDSNSGLSENDAFATIAQAIASTCDRDTVVLLDGVYYEDSLEVNTKITIGSKFLKDGDESHIANTVIHGSNEAWVLHWNTQQAYSWADTTYNRIEGLTIRGGNSTTSSRAGGVTVPYSRVLQLRNVVLDSNTNNQNNGGALWVENSSRVYLKDVDFSSNYSNNEGAGLYAAYSYLAGKNISFSNNSGNRYSALMGYSLRQFNISDVLIESNISSDAGIISFNLYDIISDAYLTNWTIRNNSSNHSILIFDDGARANNKKIFIDNLLLVNNNVSTNEFPGLRFYNSSGEYVIRNATIYNNYSSGGSTNSAQIHMGWAHMPINVKILNSIIDNAGGYSIASEGNSNISVSLDHSMLSGGSTDIYEGTGSSISQTNAVSGQPYFVDAASGDYSLSPYSTAIGAGISSATFATTTVNAPTYDLYGATRANPSGTSPDLGAIESSEGTPQMGMLSIVEHNGFCETNSGSITVNLLNYSGAASYQWKSLTDANWSWNSTQTASNLADGTYRAIALDNSTSVKLDSVDVVISNSPIISITNQSSSVACNGELNGQLEFNIDGGNPFGSSMYQYTIEYLESASIADGFVVDQDGWHFTSDNNSSNRSNSFKSNNYAEAFRNGYYEVTVTDEDGCSVTDTLTLDYLYGLPEVTITTLSSDNVAGLTSMCSGTGNTISLTADVTGGGGTNTYAWSNSSTAQTIGVAQTDEYYVEVTDQNTCVGGDTIDIYFQGAPEMVLEGQGPPLYSGQSIAGLDNSNSVYLGEHLGHHYYMVYANLTWEEARDQAAIVGGYLAIPNDKDENLAIENLIAQQNARSEAWLGVFWNGTNWETVRGEEANFTYWWGTTNPNSQRTPYSQYSYAYKSMWSTNWFNGDVYDEKSYIIEFGPTDAPVSFNQNFCDSVKLKATPFIDGTDPGFTEVYWTDANTGDTLNIGEYGIFSSSQEIVLKGDFVRSDGSSCDLTSTTYSFEVFDSPVLSITNYSGTVDLLGGDTIVFVASADTGTVTWLDTVGNIINNDTLYATAPGTYTARSSTLTCESLEEVEIYKPIYVAKTGNDVSGDGTFANPFKTIQHGVNMATEGQKIYVLPGTYEEQVIITKGVYLTSNYERLIDTSAIASTIIKPGSTAKIEDQNNSNYYSYGGVSVVSTSGDVTVSGFTIKDFEVYYEDWWRSGAISINDNGEHKVEYKNLVITGTKQKQNQSCCSAAKVISANNSQNVVFDNVTIKNSGSDIQDVHRLAFLHNVNLHATELKLMENYSSGVLFRLESNSKMTVINSVFSDGLGRSWNQYPIWLEGGSDFIAINSTFKEIESNPYEAAIYVSGSGSDILLFNSLIDAKEILYHSGSNNKLEIVNSLVSTNVDLTHSGLTVTLDSANVFFGLANTKVDYSLPSSSTAIGNGSIEHVWNGNTYYAPKDDIYGKARPIPAGSNVDIGAVESDKAVGDFDVQIANCGNRMDINIFNTNSYSIEVTGPANFTSSNKTSLQLNILGQYTVTVFDSLTATTITRSLNHNNPLKIGYLWSKDACTSNGGYGEIVFGDFQGGEDINPFENWFDYYVYVYDTDNTYSNNWQVHQGAQNTWNATVQSGEYIVELRDGSGCSVYDTVLIEETIGSRYYISTTGSDTADGTLSGPLSTIQEALGRACDGDTIVLLDGEYFENIMIDGLSPYVTIASEMILDGNQSHVAATIVNGSDEDPVFEVRNKDNSSDRVIFYGFTVTNGKSNSNWYGGGGISAQYSDIELNQMLISGNRSGNSGGGLGLSYTKLWLSNTIIEDNIANSEGGGMYLDGVAEIDAVGEVIIRNNKANGNGGGVSWNGHWSTELSLSNLIIENNQSQGNGGGLNAQNGWWNNNSNITFENLIVQNNRSTGGAGGVHINGSGNDLVLRNTIIAFNKSNSVGGLQLENSDIDVIHTTVYKNTVLNASTSNDQIKIHNNANVLFLNSAVGGQEAIGASTAHTFYIDDYDTTCDLTISNSIISGGTNSIDNPNGSTISGTPLGQALYLMDPANGDYMLSPVSVGLGAGASFYSGITIPSTDIYGQARPGTAGQDPDIGAVESPLDSASFGAAYEIRNNIACDPTYGRLKVIPLNGSGSYKYELDDLTGTATFNDQQNVPSYTYSSLYSGDYLVTITDLSTLAAYTDTVSITGKDSLSLTKNISNEFCAGEANGSITLRVSGGDGYYDYTWSTATNSGYPKSSTLNNLSPEEYFVTVKDGDNCFIEDSVTIVTLHSIPTVAITGEINKAGTIVTSTNPQIRACAGDEVTLDAGAGFVTYNWTTIDQLNSWTTQTLDASYEQGFYVTVIDSFGCTNSDTAEVFYVQAPAVFASNVNTNIGAAMQSVTSYVEGASQSLGDGYNDAKPYGAGDAFAKMQFIIPASELIAEGLTDQTTINSIGFEVSVETGSPIQNFKVKMKNTTANQLNSNFETGLTQVYSLNILTPGEGWNTHTFDEGFVWDGTKNLLVQVEYSNIAFSGGSDHLLMGADMSYDATAVAKGSSSVQNSTSSDFRSTWRPNMKFGIDKVQATDTLRVCDFTMLNTTDDYDTYSWMVNNVSQSSLLRYSVNSPLEVVLKTVDAASSCTMYSDTVQVLLDTTPTVFVSNNALVGCIGDSLTVGIDSLNSEVNYSWSNGVMDTVGLFTESGQYYVYATSPSGCQGVDTVSVDINIPPDVVVELNGRVLTSTDGSLVADNSSCDTTLILPYYTMVDALSMLGSSEWSTYSDEYLTWEYQQGWDSLVDFTGPTYDADSNFYGGFYQFDPASLTDQNKVGYLQLGCVNLLGMGSPELSFDYHMVDVYADSANTSDQMGSLELQVKAAGDDNWSTVWQRSGTDASYDWVTKSLSLNAYVNKTIQLRWKGVAGVGGPRSEIALDNIGINDSLALLSNVAGRTTPETVCEGDSLFANTVSNGTTNFSFAWNTGDTTSAVELHNSGWYAVTIIDEKNCQVTSDSVYIEVNPAPDNMLVVSDTMQYCEGVFDSLMITAAAGYDHYQWYSNYGSGYVAGDTASAIEVDSIVTGIQSFYVMLTDSLGCRNTAEAIDIVQTPTPQLVLTSNDVLCNSDSTGSVDVMATGSGSWNYSWSTGDTLSSISAVPTGWYTVSVVDTFTCSAVDSVFVGEPSAVALSVQSTVDVDCYGSSSGSADISFTGGVGGYTYSWTDTTGTWSSSNEDLNFAPAGQYFVTAQDSNGCSLSDTVSITEPTELLFTVDSVLDLTCKGNMDGYIAVSAAGGMMPYTFIANNDTNTTGEFYNLDSNYYVLTVLDSNGCSVVDGAVVSQPDPPFDGEEICIVTVDTSGVNLVVWEKTPQKRTSEYIILRENTSTQYVSIGTNQYNDMSTFADQNSNPAVQPYRYRLALMDSCGFYSDTSGYHATIHLQASPGVASNEVQLQWTAYEGKTVQTYYIYRWLSPTNRVLIDSVSSNVQTYTDIYPVNTAITALIYEVSAKFVNGSCSPTMNKKAPYEGSFSNRLDWGNDSGLPIGTDEWVNTVLEHNLEIFPNPTLGILNLDLKGAWEEQRNIRIAVTDLTGRVLAKDVVQGAGRKSFDFRELPAGIYFIQIITDEGRTIVKRFERIN